MLSQNIQLVIKDALRNVSCPQIDAFVQVPTFQNHGDYTTNVSLILAKQMKKKPMDLATEITQEIQKNLPDFLEKVECIHPGFINFFVSKKYLFDVLSTIRNKGEKYGENQVKAEDVVFIEHTQPNTNKPLHIGHLRNAILGMSIVHMYRTQYGHVESTNINNDRGIANIKGMWAYLFFGQELKNNEDYDPAVAREFEWQNVLDTWTDEPQRWKTPLSEEFERGKGDYFVGKFYVVADGMGENEVVGEKVKGDWAHMLKAWEEETDPYHEKILHLWKRMNDWFYQGSRGTMDRLGVVFSIPEEYESLLYKKGKIHIEKALKEHTKNIVRLEDGAIQAKLADYNLPDKILVRRDGTAIYMTFDIELTRKRVQEMGMDRGIWVVGSDQELYFKQLFAVCDILKLSTPDKLYHFSFGMVRLTSGKLSSRKGRVIYADDVLDVAVQAAQELIDANDSLSAYTPEQRKEVAECIGVGAVKYSILKIDPKSEILFDVSSSVTLQGNSGPYVQYTVVRAQSVIDKSGKDIKKLNLSNTVVMNEQESSLVRMLSQYPEVIQRATVQHAPHDICTYLFELAQTFNAFYTKTPILKAENDGQSFRLVLCSASCTVLTHGLGLLGISVPKFM